MTKITLVVLGQTGPGPVYSLEMAKALYNNNECKLQIIISEGLMNLDVWKETFQGSRAEIHIVKAYSHSIRSVFFQFFNYYRKTIIVRLIKGFKPDVLYIPFGLMWARFIFAFVPKRTHIIYTIHDVHPHDRFNLAEDVSKFLQIGSRRFIDGYIILNEKDKHYVEKKYKKPVAVIPHASFAYYFKDSSQTKQCEIKYRIGYFGRIEPYKGLDVLIDAFGIIKVPNIKLLIAGSGLISPELMEQIRKDDRIELINRYIEDEEFQPLLGSVDFVILPYKRASQSGVIPMCFAAGKTVVATNVGALDEQVPQGTGLIVDPSAQAIADAVCQLYNQPELIKEYGVNAKHYASKVLSWDHSAELLMDFCRQF